MSLETAREDFRNLIGLDVDFERKVKRSSSPISSRTKSQIFEKRTMLQRIVLSTHFDTVCGLAIVCNILAIGLQANERATSITTDCNYVLSEISMYVNLFFTIFFFIELALRGFVLRCDFFYGKDMYWNIFDCIVVVSAVGEEVIQRIMPTGGCDGNNLDLGKGISALRIVRVLRLIRIVRAIRVMHLFRDLRVMIQSVLGCVKPFCWASTLLLIIHWMFGVYFVSTAADYISDGLVVREPEEAQAWLADPVVVGLQEHFGSLWVGLYTLFKSITGGIDWGEAAEPLLEVGAHHVLLYVLYVALTLFAVLNVVTGMFVQTATKIAMQDQELVIQDQLERRGEYIENALRIFEEADNNGDRMMSWEEFEAHLADPRVQAFFGHLELTGVEARRLFRLLDLDNDGVLDAAEFVTGCLCLRGAAKTVDVAALTYDLRKVARQWQDFIESMSARFEQCVEQLPKAVEV